MQFVLEVDISGAAFGDERGEMINVLQRMREKVATNWQDGSGEIVDSNGNICAHWTLIQD